MAVEGVLKQGRCIPVVAKGSAHFGVDNDVSSCRILQWQYMYTLEFAARLTTVARYVRIRIWRKCWRRIRKTMTAFMLYPQTGFGNQIVAELSINRRFSSACILAAEYAWIHGRSMNGYRQVHRIICNTLGSVSRLLNQELKVWKRKESFRIRGMLLDSSLDQKVEIFYKINERQVSSPMSDCWLLESVLLSMEFKSCIDQLSTEIPYKKNKACIKGILRII